ncbi:uncharacterized protein K441DRAFT_730119 [Cenococcum geophilum 1.58]|uniref:uncharacterized protein n=1 Tax=Cenococcum geophilum 1.58 TaxID=794803 RepID=UPI00358E6ADF|nr:hypothetical protein K441DRAFT_730119 [Cenococcum geophilum 1.58]
MVQYLLVERSLSKWKASTRPVHADDDQSIAGYEGKLGAEQMRAQPIRPPGSTEEPWDLRAAAAAAAARHNNRHREVAQRGVGWRRVCWEPQTWRGPSWHSGSLEVQQSNYSGSNNRVAALQQAGGRASRERPLKPKDQAANALRRGQNEYDRRPKLSLVDAGGFGTFLCNQPCKLYRASANRQLTWAARAPSLTAWHSTARRERQTPR